MPVDYTRLATHYDAVRADEAFDRAYWLAGLVDVAGIEPGERIPDLGAGTGRFARLLAPSHPVVAFDRSWEMLSIARARASVGFVRGDAHRLSFRDDSFDLTLASMVLHQLEDLNAALREISRVSRRLAIATSDLRSRRMCILEEAFPSLLAIDRARFPHIPTLVAALREAGFSKVRVQTRPLHRMMPVAEELEWIRRKYLSTLDLLPPGEFEHGLRFLGGELPRRFGDRYEEDAAFTFLGATGQAGQPERTGRRTLGP